jgi:hypothetical protein
MLDPALTLRPELWEEIQAGWHRIEPIRCDRNEGGLACFMRFTYRCEMTLARDGQTVSFGIREEIAQRNPVHAAYLRESLQGRSHSVRLNL